MSGGDRAARARAVFGEGVFASLQVLALDLRTRRMAEKDRAEAEEQIRDASSVAEETRKAVEVARSRLGARPKAILLAERERWRRLAALLEQARTEAAEIVSLASKALRGPLVAKYPETSRRAGRPDATGRARLVREARAAMESRPWLASPTKTPGAGDWAALSFALGIEKPGDDFEHVRRLYADLIKPLAPRPAKRGKSRRRRVARGR